MNGVADIIMIYVDAFKLPSENFSIDKWFKLGIKTPHWDLDFNDFHVGVSMQEKDFKIISKLRGLPSDTPSFHLLKMETLTIAESIKSTDYIELIDRMHDSIIKKFKEVLTFDLKKLIEMEEDDP